jgi:glyoxylase I family protein
MFKGIEHTAIATPEPEALAQWYEKNLGFPICHRYGGNVFVKAPDGSMLELIPSIGERVHTEIKTPGIRHLAIQVEDFDASVKALEAQDIEIFERIEGGANRLAFFRDPEGNILHLIYRASAI